MDNFIGEEEYRNNSENNKWQPPQSNEEEESSQQTIINVDDRYDEAILFYENGDYEKAREAFESIAPFSSDANYMLGVIYYEGLSIEKDYKIALNYFNDVRNDDIDKYYMLGSIYFYGGYGVEQNFELAKTNLEIPFSQGNYDAAYLLGVIHYNNENYREARECFLEALRGENQNFRAESSFYLGIMYLYGLEVTQNIEKAEIYFDQAESLGHSKDQIMEIIAEFNESLNKEDECYEENATTGPNH